MRPMPPSKIWPDKYLFYHRMTASAKAVRRRLSPFSSCVMPNLKTHLKVGASLGCIAGIVCGLDSQNRKMRENPEASFDWKELLLHSLYGTAAGVIGGVLPDVLEPALHSHHRKICHGMGALALSTIGATRAGKHPGLNPHLKTAAIAGCIGYGSHLVLDASTPRGIPLLV